MGQRGEIALRIMGLDFGAKTVGVAISDPLLHVARPIEVIRRPREDKQRRTLARIEELIREYDVSRIVLGMPYHMDEKEGENPRTYGERGVRTLAFREKLARRSGLPIELVDERLTTFEARETMDAAGLRRDEQEPHVDMLAAALILKEYLTQNEKQR